MEQDQGPSPLTPTLPSGPLGSERLCPPSSGREIADPHVAAFMARHGGLRVTVCPTVTLPRRWSERLWSRPWRPWVARGPSARVPKPDQCIIADGKLLMGEEFHRRVAAEMRPQVRPEVRPDVSAPV